MQPVCGVTVTDDRRESDSLHPRPCRSDTWRPGVRAGEAFVSLAQSDRFSIAYQVCKRCNTSNNTLLRAPPRSKPNLLAKGPFCSKFVKIVEYRVSFPIHYLYLVRNRGDSIYRTLGGSLRRPRRRAPP